MSGAEAYLAAVAAGDPTRAYPALPGSPPAPIELSAGNDYWPIADYHEVRRLLTAGGRYVSNAPALTPPFDLTSGAYQAFAGEGLMDRPPLYAALDGPAHAAARQRMANVMHTRPHEIAADLGPVLDQLLDHEASRLTQVSQQAGRTAVGETVDLVPAISNVIMGELSHLTGADPESLGTFKASAHSQAELIWGPPNPDETTQVNGIRGFAGVLRIADETYDHHAAISRSERPDNMVARLLDAETSREEASMIIATTLNAGYNTSVGTIVDMMAGLLKEEGSWRALHDDPASIESLVDEGIRVHSAIYGWYKQFMANATPEQRTVGGVELPPEARLLLLLGAANADPARGERPDLTFSMGPHRCLGAEQARYVIGKVVAGFALRFPDMQFVAEQHTSGIGFRTPNQLLVTL